LLDDLKHAIRALSRRKPLFLMAVATLALGIGASTSLFSVVNGVLLRPLPYRASDRLVVLWHVFGQGAQDLPAMHQKDFADYRDRSRTLEELTIATGNEAILGDESDPQIVKVGLVQTNFFGFLGVAPQLGRDFKREEDVPGTPRALILSDRLWRSRFGSDASVIGRTVLLNGQSAEIVGVLPPGFTLELPAETYALRDSDVYRPAQINFNTTSPRNLTSFTVFGRMAPGVSVRQAQDEMSGIAAQLRAEHPVHAASDLRVKVIPYHQDVVKGARRGLWMLMTAVVFVLAIACSNVALLMLAWARGRERELLIRATIGANRARIARLVLIESLLIATCGGILGVVLADFGLTLLNARALSTVPRIEAASIDVTVLAFAMGASMLSAIGFGFAPSIRAAQVNLSDGLRAAAVGSPSRQSSTVRDGIVVAQIALGLVLVIGAALVVQSFTALADSDPGFDARGVLALRVQVPPRATAGPPAARAYHLALAERLHQLPGVNRAGVVSQLPLSGQGPLQPYAYDAETARRWESLSAEGLGAAPGYFETMGITMLAGRDFSTDDLLSGRRLIVIDETLATRAYGAPDKAIGRQLQLEPEGAPESFSEIIGVVRHVRYHDLRRELLPQIYQPVVFGRFHLVVRTDGDPAALAGAVQRVLAEAAPGTAAQQVQPLAAIVDDALGPTRLAVWLMTGFGAIALMLASVGLYGVFSYFVVERTREISVRLALGATPSSMQWLVVGRGLKLAAIGSAIGIVAAVALSRAAATVLYGVSAVDAWTYGAAVLCLVMVAAAACWLPALRASRVDPQAGLRA
jgi:putative ABC transport system permease protein